MAHPSLVQPRLLHCPRSLSHCQRHVPNPQGPGLSALPPENAHRCKAVSWIVFLWKHANHQHPPMHGGGWRCWCWKGAEVGERESVGRREKGSLMDLLEGEIGGGENGVKVNEANSRLKAMASKPEVE
ncbi:Conjugative transposon protein TraM [Sesbania bispinosa]|nr:Conjugative transposon protein TraM [Sesbania bispinosa]